MKVAIVNQHSLNYGDDLAGMALIQNIREYLSPSRIDIIYNTHGQLPVRSDIIHHRKDLTLKRIGFLSILFFMIGQFFNIRIIIGKEIRHFLLELKKSDVIFVSPSGANLGIYRDWRFLIKSLLALATRRKVVFCNNTIGRSGNLLFDFFENKVLRKSILYVREKKSYRFLDKKNFKPIRGVDTAFSLKLSLDGRYDGIEENDYMVFVPTELSNWHPDYKNQNINNLLIENFLPQVVKLQSKKHWGLKILPHKYGEANESKFLTEIEGSLISSGIDKSKIEICKVENCFEYEQILKHSQFNITMRYHGEVMSIKNGVPFLSMEYENKMQEVSDYSGVSDLNYKLKDLLNENVDLEKIYKHASTEVGEMRKVAPKLEEIASAPVKQIAFALNNRVN